jgi:hypothetical protein
MHQDVSDDGRSLRRVSFGYKARSGGRGLGIYGALLLVLPGEGRCILLGIERYSFEDSTCT